MANPAMRTAPLAAETPPRVYVATFSNAAIERREVKLFHPEHDNEQRRKERAGKAAVR